MTSIAPDEEIRTMAAANKSREDMKAYLRIQGVNEGLLDTLIQTYLEPSGQKSSSARKAQASPTVKRITILAMSAFTPLAILFAEGVVIASAIATFIILPLAMLIGLMQYPLPPIIVGVVYAMVFKRFGVYRPRILAAVLVVICEAVYVAYRIYNFEGSDPILWAVGATMAACFLTTAVHLVATRQRAMT